MHLPSSQQFQQQFRVTERESVALIQKMELERQKLRAEIDILSQEKEKERRQILETSRDEIRKLLNTLDMAIRELPDDDPVERLIAVRQAHCTMREKIACETAAEVGGSVGTIVTILGETEADITRLCPSVAELAKQREAGRTEQVSSKVLPNESFQVATRMEQARREIQPHVRAINEKLRHLNSLFGV